MSSQKSTQITENQIPGGGLRLEVPSLFLKGEGEAFETNATASDGLLLSLLGFFFYKRN